MVSRRRTSRCLVPSPTCQMKPFRDATEATTTCITISATKAVLA
jgi:hypothetical protein